MFLLSTEPNAIATQCVIILKFGNTCIMMNGFRGQMRIIQKGRLFLIHKFIAPIYKVYVKRGKYYQNISFSLEIRSHFSTLRLCLIEKLRMKFASHSTGNVTVCCQPSQRKNKGCRKQSIGGKPSRSKLNSVATAHEQLATWSFFFLIYVVVSKDWTVRRVKWTTCIRYFDG